MLSSQILGLAEIPTLQLIMPKLLWQIEKKFYNLATDANFPLVIFFFDSKIMMTFCQHLMMKNNKLA